MLDRLIRAFLVLGRRQRRVRLEHGPARFPRPTLDARLGDGLRVAICVPPGQPARGHHGAALRHTILFGGAADRTRRAARAHP